MTFKLHPKLWTLTYTKYLFPIEGTGAHVFDVSLLTGIVLEDMEAAGIATSSLTFSVLVKLLHCVPCGVCSGRSRL